MKKLKRQMLIATIIYAAWVIAFICFGIWVLDMQYEFLTKGILTFVQIVYLVIMWRLWKKLTAATIKENEDRRKLNG